MFRKQAVDFSREAVMQETFQRQQRDRLPLSIVVPCFNEELGLREFVRRCFQLMTLSIIGEDVGRIYLSTKSRPLFIIDAIERGAMQ
jgi:hypothetical protein